MNPGGRNSTLTSPGERHKKHASLVPPCGGPLTAIRVLLIKTLPCLKQTEPVQLNNLSDCACFSKKSCQERFHFSRECPGQTGEKPYHVPGAYGGKSCSGWRKPGRVFEKSQKSQTLREGHCPVYKNACLQSGSLEQGAALQFGVLALAGAGCGRAWNFNRPPRSGQGDKSQRFEYDIWESFWIHS